MATMRAEVFRDHVAEAVVSQLSCGRRRPSSRMNQPAAVLYDVRQLAENKIAIHPVQGLAQCHQLEPAKIRQDIFNARVQPTNAPTSPFAGQSPSLLEHQQRRGLQRGRLRRCGKGELRSCQDTTKVEDARASGEGKRRK